MKRSESIPATRAWATHAALLVVQFAFASQTVEGKLLMLPRSLGGEGLFPEALAMMRMLGGALFFQSVLHLGGTHSFPAAPLSRLDHVRLAGLSLLGITLNQALFLFGLRSATPFAAALLGATIPVFAAGLSIVMRKERGTARTAVGIALSLTGVLTLGKYDPSQTRGVVLVALNSLSYAAYIVLARDTVIRLGTLRTMAWLFLYGAISFAPLGLAPMIVALPALTPRGIVLVGYIVLVPTLLAYGLNAWALGRTSASVVTIYIYLQPFIAALLGWIQLGVAIGARAVVAAAFVLSGLGVVAFRRPTSRAS